jgi:autotransporter-associated beta strand protein
MRVAYSTTAGPSGRQRNRYDRVSKLARERVLVLVSLSVMGVSARDAIGQTTYYWDTNGTAAGAVSAAGPASGSWNSVAAVWNTALAGDGSGSLIASPATGSNLTFAAQGVDITGTSSVAVTGSQSMASLNFLGSGAAAGSTNLVGAFSLSGGDLTLTSSGTAGGSATNVLGAGAALRSYNTGTTTIANNIILSNPDGTATIYKDAGNLTVSGGLTLGAGAAPVTLTARVRNGASMTFSGVVGGTGGVTVTSSGGATVSLSNPANTFTGPVAVITTSTTASNTLTLSGTSLGTGTNASSLGAGGGTIYLSGNGPSSVQLQINATTPVSTDRPIVLLASDTLGGNKGNAILATTNTAAGTVTYSGPLSIGTANAVKTLVLTAGSATTTGIYSGSISPGAAGATLGILRTDNRGTWILSGSNSYNGPTVVTGTGGNNGPTRLILRNSFALGNTTGVTQSASGQVVLDGGVTLNKPLSIGTGNPALAALTGDNTWAGPVTVTAANTRIANIGSGTLTISGVIDSGGTLFSTAFGGTIDIRGPLTTQTVTFSGANVYLGDTGILAGTLRLAGGNNRLPVTTGLLLGINTVSDPGLLDLNGTSQEVAAINFSQTGVPTNSGVINTSSTPATLTVNAPLGRVSNFGGVISGATSFVKSGAETVTLSGALSYTRDTRVTAGVLNVQSTLRPVTGSLVVTGPGSVANLTLTGDYAVPGEFSTISLGSNGQSGVSKVTLAASSRGSAGKPTVLVTSGLTVSPSAGGTGLSGFLDLGNNDMIIKGGASNLGTLRSYIKAWLTTGNTGLGASLASPTLAPYTTLALFANDAGAGRPYFTSYDGVTGLTASDVIVKYTYVGDTNLDGVLDGRDYKNVMEGFVNGASGWNYGDVDHSGGAVSASDFTAFLIAYDYFRNAANQAPVLGDGQQAGGSTASVIPEPLALNGLVFVAWIGRRRR